jgi:hypothetical protein
MKYSSPPYVLADSAGGPENPMPERAVAAAVEQALRTELALTDQPRAAILAIARQLFEVLEQVDRIAGQQRSESVEAVRREFCAAFAKVWREYGEDGAAPPIQICTPDGFREPAVQNA